MELTAKRKWSLSNWVILFAVFSLLSGAAFYNIYRASEVFDGLVFRIGIVNHQAAELARQDVDLELGKLFVVWLFSILAVTILTFLTLRKSESLKAQIDKEKLLLESIDDGVVT